MDPRLSNGTRNESLTSKRMNVQVTQRGNAADALTLEN